MATNLELRSSQKRTLYKLLKLKAVNKAYTVIDLDDVINELEAEMEPEDVAYVKQTISQLYQ
ncbi:MAG: hypothetical protein FWE20_12805 [Defluviitaleaceae bacterium]|nr:hypothetical protein [Defluviitaleaceae bacterium]